MSDLTGKQKRRLRGVGQRLSPAVLMGKAGLTEGIIARIQTSLEGRELIKVRLPGEAPDRKALAQELARSVEATCVGLTGRSVLLYRSNPDLDPDDRIRMN
jgi:RNA-binding protein